MKIFDTHAHYEDEAFEEDREEVLEQLRREGILRVVNVGASLDSCKRTLEVAGAHEGVFAAIGIHPDEVGTLTEADLAWLEQTAGERRYPGSDVTQKVVAIGEIGLDYYWDKADHERQKEMFLRQMEIAGRLSLPIIVHSREAAQDTYDTLKKGHAEELGGVIHCFAQSVEMAKKYLEMGFYLGIGGVVTFRNARVVKEVVQAVPLERMVLETDCPYLAPVPYRGKRNSSLYLPYMIEAIAKLKGISMEETAAVTWENAHRLYRLPLEERRTARLEETHG